MDAVQQQDRFTFALAAKVRQTFHGLILHNEDHHVDRLCAYCPIRYFELINKTFFDDKVFTVCNCHPVLLKTRLQHKIDPHLLKRCKWGFNFAHPLPNAYILPKGKKMYTSGRPIIASRKSACGKILQVTGKLLADIVCITCPQTFGNRTIPDVFKDLKVFMAFLKNNNRRDYSFHNDDLKGFFTSVPHDCILQALNWVVRKYADSNPSKTHFDKVVFTVKTKSATIERTIRGRSFACQSKDRILYLADLVAITKVALNVSHFSCMGKVFQQSRGACIGGQASPAICAIVVAFREQMWLSSYNTLLSSRQLCIRYVDNRALMLSPEDEQLTRFKTLLDLEFYRLPIELEQCGHAVLLGFTIDMRQLEILYVPPAFSRQYRSSRSAGSNQRVLSGLGARLHILHKGTFPKEKIPGRVAMLLAGYKKKGFSFPLLRKISYKVASRFGKSAPT